mgnify:CR=1 FL=1
MTYKGQTLEKDVDFTITSGDSFSGVGPCTLTIKAKDSGDYTGSKSAQWTVRPLKVAASVGDIIKTYDGTTDLPENTKITFKSADSYYPDATLRLAKGTDYEVSNARYDSADASETEKTVSFTVKLKNKGYVFEDGTTQKDFTLNGADFDDKTFQINKATVPMNNPTGTLNIINGTCQTYTYDFNNILPGLSEGKYGTISYGQADISLVSQSEYNYGASTAVSDRGVLTLAQFSAEDGKMTGRIGTVKVTVTTTNYENFQLKLVLNAMDQIKPEPDGTITAAEITYGDALSKSTISGKMKDPNTGDAVNGTFTWTDGTIKPDANDRYEAEWTFTPAAGYEKYATATGTVTIKVKPAKLIVSVKASSMYYTGEEQIASIIASGQSVDSTPVTFTYSDKVDGNYTSGVPTFTDAGTYTAYYKAEAANHEPATGTFTVTIDPLPISLLSVSSISKTYDGSADVTLTADKLTFFSKTAKATNIKLPDTALTFSDAQFTSKQEDGSYLPSPEVGNGKALSFTMTLTSNNYVFEGKSEGTTKVSDVFATDDVNRFTITKAAAPTNIQSGTLTITNGLHKTYSFDLSTLLPKLTAPCDYGTITYDKKVDTNLGVGSFITLVNGKTGELTLEANRSGTDEGQFGTITVTISTSNYQDITLTVNIFAKNKLTPVMDGKITASKITYGQALSDSSITGKMKDPNTGDEVNGTFTWTDGAVKPDANDRYEAEWTFTPDSEEYATVTDTATVEVAPKSIEGAVITLESADLEYNAAEQSPKITGVTLENWDETGITYIIKSGDKATDVSDRITLTIEGIGNYTGTATVEWKITPKTVTPTIEVEPCTYTGDALEPAVTVKDDIGNIIDQKEYEIFYSNNTNAGIATVTIKDVEGGNYVIKEKTQDFTITKAAAPTNIQSGTLTITNGTQQTYTYDFSKLLPEAPNGDYGTVRYDLGNRQTAINFTAHGYYLDPEIAEFEGSKLTLVGLYAKDGTAIGQIGTVKVNVTTTNYADFQLTLVLNAINQIKPTPDGTITASEITYGDALSKSTISGKMKDPDTGKSVNGTFAWTDGTIKPDAGSYDAEWTFTPAEGYEEYATATGTVTVKVNKATPTFTAPTAQENLTYTGQEQALITAGSVTSGGTMQYSLTENGTYSPDIPTGTDAGAYTVWYRVIGDANHKDTAPASVAVRIGQKPLTITGVTAASKLYDGTTNADITSVTFDNVTLKRDTDYNVTASFDYASVDSGKNVTATVTLMGQAAKNYALEQSSFPTTGSITKAAAPDFTRETALVIVNGHEKTYTVTLPALPTLETPKAYGALTYEIGEIKLNDGYYTSGAKVENGELTLPIQKNDVETTGSVGTVTVVIKSANYEDITLTVNVSAKNKLSPVLAGTLTLTPIKITYGEPLSKIKITGTMKAGDTVVEGTFSWQQPGDTILDASTSGHDVGWTFTPKDGNTYTEVTGTVKVPVAPKSIEGAAITLEKYEFQYNAAEQSPKITGVTLENWDETGITYITKSGDKATDANDSIPLTIEGTGNYTGTAMVEWKITPKTVTPTIEVESCTYTGDALEPAVTVKDDIGNIIDQKEYEIFYSNNTNAGIATVTIKDVEGGNYVLSGASKTFEITKAAAPATEVGSLTITNGLRTTYSLDLSTLLPKLTAPCNYGTITYDRKVDTNLGVGSFITLVDGKTGELTLDANRSGTDEGQFGTITVTISTSNYQDITLTVNVSAKNRITPTGTPTLSKNAITYGDALNTIALSGKLHDNVNNVDVDGTFEWVDGTHIPVVGNGTYAAEWIFEPTDTEKYLTVSGRSNITVEKAQQYGKLSMAGYTYGKTPSTPTLTDRTGDLNAQVTYRYAAADSGSVQTWDISNPPVLNAGTYRMYASIGDTDNYYGFEAVYCEFVVAKATPTYTVPTGLTAKYGQTLADVTLPDGWSWMDSSESVGGASVAVKPFKAKFTPTDTANYNTVENIKLDVTVNKANGGSLKTVELTQKYTDTSEHTYTPDWLGLPDGQTWSYSSEHSVNNGSKATLTKQDIAAANDKLTYAISGGKAGDKITITLKASCNNYEDFTITLTITLTARDDQKPLTITGDTSVIYGEKLTLTTTGGSGTGAVTYRIDTALSTGEATIDPETGVLTPVKVGSVSVIATKAGDNDYNDVTSTPFVLMIKPATPTGEPKYTAITTSGKTLKDAALTTKGSTLNPSDGKLEWVDDKGEPLPDDTTVKANTTYKWRFTPDDDNYTTLTGEVELYHKSSSDGGWYDSYYTIKATAGAGGSISPSGSVSVREGRDQTFTITPDKGYAVANVKIDGKSIGAVKSYTFENVRRTHTIEVIFMKGNGNPQAGVFVDVATGSYYEDAVDWAVENGITQGTDDTHFAPDGICTRAQAVAFLWRAAGSPKLKTRTMPFADVPVGSYYYDAVLWAVENGITEGTSDTTFSPNMTCTRAQIVAFLWRSEKSPAAGTANPFADVKSTAYYADAVLWAAKEDITKGTTNTTFSPDADCTRAQIVTFLWRCKK